MDEYFDEELISDPRQLIPEPVQNQYNKIKKKVEDSARNFERRNRVTMFTIIMMLSVAILYDGVQFLINFIPYVGWIFSFFLSIWSWLTFYTWGSVNGWRTTDTVAKYSINWVQKFKPVANFMAKYVFPFLELIPIVNDLPTITLGVLITILIIKSDDFIYNRTKGRVDAEIIKEGIEFFNVFRDVYHV